MSVSVASLLLASLATAFGVFEHALYDTVSLDGAWEMTYRPYAWETVDCPTLYGVAVTNAVPGYWEDLVPTFRAAGMTDAFRTNPWYEEQTYPIFGRAGDMTLPDIYGCFVYRRKVDLKRTGRAVLRFEGVRNQVHVWINGQFVKFRAGFSTPFEITIPEGVLKTGPNEIVLAVSNNPNLGYCDYVSGLTTRSVFRSTGGVNGKLELRFLEDALADVYVTTAANLKTFTVHMTGSGALRYEIVDGNLTLAQGETNGPFTLPTDGFEFWSPENPKRYELRLTTANGEVTQLFGIRRLVADGEKLRLNGRPVYLRGVTEHCYFARTVHVPRDLDYYRMVTRKRKELGFNFVRFHTFVPPVEYLEATDELGMLVHIESPNFVPEPEYAAIVAFARRHPSVVIYCTGNETRIDRLAETYLEDVAKIVHTGSDALFSPMSALRGVEYAFEPGKDETVCSPFRHNPERMRRLAVYSDLFTSYQQGATSYDSVNMGTGGMLDRWGDAYCGRPRISHEICIDGSYVDLSLEASYPPDSPILRTGVFSGLRGQLASRGLLDRADTYFRNSCEWMRRIRKFTFEKVRASERTVGFDFLGDINTHWHTFGYSVGMMDEFYRLKPGETVENVLRYNSPAVLLCDLGSDFNVAAGERKAVTFALSNYADAVSAANLVVELVDACTGRAVAMVGRSWADRPIPNGCVTSLGAFEFRIPEDVKPHKYMLRARFAGDEVVADNEWEIYAFPGRIGTVATNDVTVVANISESDLLAALARGERILLLGVGPFNSLPSTFRIGMAGRCGGDFATIIQPNHPLLADLPHEGYCGWQFRRLMEGGRTIQLEAEIPFEPIIEVASAVKCIIRQASLFEYRVGEGRLLVCSLNLDEKDPAARWLQARLVSYAKSDAFVPARSLTPEQLSAVIHAPLLSGAKNDNRAHNPNDPAGEVRARALAQP